MIQLKPQAKPAAGAKNYFPLIFSGAPSAKIIEDIAPVVHQKPGITATWILSCEDVTADDTAIRTTVKRLVEQHGDDVGYFLRSGMGLASGGGVPAATQAQVFQILDECFAEFKSYFGSYPILAMWISDIHILKHVQEKFGAEIAITADWQTYRTDTISATGSFDYPFYPSVNHPLVPGKSQIVDILNFETQHPDLYWSKASYNRPGFEPVLADSLEQMQLLTNSVYQESSFNNNQIRVLPAILELGYTYLEGPSEANDYSEYPDVNVLKSWLDWMISQKSDIQLTNISTFNQAFRRQQSTNSSAYAVLQSGSNGAFSGVAYPSRSTDYKTFMYWSDSYRARLDVKVGNQGHIRLSDYTPYDDGYKQELDAQDISIYEGMNHLELANIGLQELWSFGNETLSINAAHLGSLKQVTHLDSIHKVDQEYIVKFSIVVKDQTLHKTITFGRDSIRYDYDLGELKPSGLAYETFKATYNANRLGLGNFRASLPTGSYAPNDQMIQQPILRDFKLVTDQNLGALTKVDVIQGEDTPLDWQSSAHADDDYVPVGASSITQYIADPRSGSVSLSMVPYRSSLPQTFLEQFFDF